MMRQIVVISQWITFLVILCEMVLVFRKMRKPAHYYLFMNSIALVMYSVGSLLMLYVQSDETYFVALAISWVGKIGSVVSMLLFCIAFFESKLPTWIAIVESGISVAVCIVIFFARHTNLFYKDLCFVKEKGLTILEYRKGPWYIVWNITVIVVILTCLRLLRKAFAREKNKKKRKQFNVVLYVLLIEIPVGVLASLPIGRYYDFNQLGYLMIVIFVILSVVHNDFMDTESLAKEYVMDELSSGVVATVKKGTVMYYNKKAQQLFPDIAKNEDGVIARIEESIRTNVPITIDGSIYHFEERQMGKKSSDQSKLYVMIDSTKQYQHLKEVEKERQIADAANRAKTDFLARMSHEIRTPINAVLGMDEMILRECKDEIIKDYAKDIKNAGQALLSIVNEILDLNKIESGKMELAPVKYDLPELIADISMMIKMRAESNQLSFHVNVSPEIPAKLFGDDEKIRKVLTNLLTNAVKYTESGDVWLRVELKGNLAESEGHEAILHVEVEDTGIGIKPEDQSKLFSEFERIDSENIRTIEGTGLGLPITKKLLSLMGAELKVKSVYGKGSVFSFDLRQAVIINPSEQKQEGKDGAKKLYTGDTPFTAPNAQVLVVDDSLVNLKVFTSLLKNIQMQITEATNGRKAIELAKTQHYDIIFMDHMMPGMDGIETLKHIRAEENSPCANTPVIVLTANAIEGSRETYLEAGFDGYLSKPIATEELMKMIAQHLPEEKIIY